MQNSAYLESKVLTAPPQRLHLLLIEGAIRFGRQGEESLRRGDRVGAAPSLLRTIDIVGELLAAVRANKSDLNKKIADQYWFMLRRVSEAKINADADALAEALRLLEFERQTWQMLCDKLAGDPASAPPVAQKSRSFDATGSRSPKSGISWQA
jgi:flagellar secretion chaperone FliS